jgi:hypothetical protein
MYSKLLVTIILILVVFSVLPSVIKAEEIAPKIGVSPHTFELGVLPGQVVEQKIKVFNQSEIPVPMTTRVVDFTAADDSGQMLFYESLQEPSIASRLWFKIENPDFILDPGEVQEVRFKIEVPEDAEPGGHYAVMIFEPRFPSFYFKEESVVRNIPEIGVLFLTSVQKFTLEPDTENKLEISEFSFPKEKRLVTLENFVSRLLGSVALATEVNIVENPFLNFILRIKNNDIYHIKPSGRIVIYNFWGKRVGETEIRQLTILPGRVRIFPVEFKPQIPEKLKFLPASIADFLVRNFFVGKYEARIELVAKSPVITGILEPDIPIVLTFFSLPWKFWLSFILILGSSIFLITKYRHRLKTALKILFNLK